MPSVPGALFFLVALRALLISSTENGTTRGLSLSGVEPGTPRLNTGAFND